MAGVAWFDEVVAAAPGADLADWVARADAVLGHPVRCSLTERETGARQRLDLALRMLSAEADGQWCRPAAGHVVVVRRWSLPARAVTLLTGGEAVACLLATGRPHDGVELWRFLGDAPTARLFHFARRLLPV